MTTKPAGKPAASKGAGGAATKGAGAATKSAGRTSKAAASRPADGTWRLDTPGGSMAPRTALETIVSLDAKIAAGDLREYQPRPLGFVPLDKALGGGLRPGELLLMGGAQGTGKTTMALQAARNIASAGDTTVLYVCFEHDEQYLLDRLIALESALPGLSGRGEGVRITDVRKEVLATAQAADGTRGQLAKNPRLRPALDRIAAYGDRLFLLKGSQTASTIDNLRELVRAHRERSGDASLVLFVDYLQKVPHIPESVTEEEKVTSVVGGLKDIALAEGIPVVAIVAADKEGLKAARLRNHHLRGSSAINYEADVILILNEKYNIVAKVNIEFNPYQAQRFRSWIVATIEKNRAGQDNVDLEFEKHFEFSCFDPVGRSVQEKLIEERLYND